MRILCLLSSLLLALCLSGPLRAGEGQWRLVSERNGIQVYRQDDGDARIKTFRGVTRFPITNPASIEALLNDYDAIPRWMHFISSGREMSRRDYLDRTLQFVTEVPWPLEDRAVIAHLTVQHPSDTHLTILAEDDPKAPLDAEFLRIPDLRGRLDFRFFRETREVEVTYEIVMDPGGYIPAWIANIVLKDTPYFTLLKLRRIVDEPRYASYKGTFFDTYPW